MVNLTFFLLCLLLIPMLAGPPTVSGLPRLHNPIQLTSPNPRIIGNFGASVSGGDGMVLVGAPVENAGKTYVFNIQTGRLMFALSSTHPLNGGEFGLSLSASNSVVVVGAGSEDDNAGHAYVF